MVISLPRMEAFNLDEVPENLEKQVQKAFSEFTEGTNPDYMYQDKLLYIDHCIDILHRNKDPYEEVVELIKLRFDYEVYEYGDVPDRSDILSIEGMEKCYEQGMEDHRLYSLYYSDNRNQNEEVHKILCRIIKAVMDYEE